MTLPRYELGAKVATRKAFGEALAAIGARGDVVALDGEVGNSTHTEEFAKAHPERYFEMFIAEQQLVAAAVGLSVRGYVPFAATFAAFFTRAYDFIRMAAISEANIRLCGSHAGVEIGADGPSQMALEDLAMMRAVHGSTVLYPSDATSTALPGAGDGRPRRHRLPAHHPRRVPGAVRAGRGVPGRRGQGRPVQPGRPGDADRRRASPCTTAWPPPTSSAATASAPASWTCTRSSRSTPRRSLEAAAATGDRLVVAEDHYPEGGIGSAVLEAFNDAGHPVQITHLAVRDLPGSGTPAELMDAAGISAGHIAQAARDLLI